MFHTPRSDYLEISKQKKLPKTWTVVRTLPEYKFPTKDTQTNVRKFYLIWY